MTHFEAVSLHFYYRVYLCEKPLARDKRLTRVRAAFRQACDIISDLPSRRGRINEMRPDKGGTQIVRAQVPLSELFGYATAVRSLT